MISPVKTISVFFFTLLASTVYYLNYYLYFLNKITMKKTMTCKDMGGVCDAAMTASTPEEMMKMGGDHVNQMAGTDPAHMEIKKMMDMSMTDKVMADKWHMEFMKTWESAPEAK